jgi:hypothetical protein
MVTGFSVRRRLWLSTLQKLLTAEFAETSAEIAEKAILTLECRLLKTKALSASSADFLCVLSG